MARVIAGGHIEGYRHDYEMLYAPAVDISETFLICILAFVFRWTLRDVDVNTAFLNERIDRTIYLRHPYNLPTSIRRKHYLLHESLYRLKQSPLVWFQELKEFFVNILIYI